MGFHEPRRHGGCPPSFPALEQIFGSTSRAFLFPPANTLLPRRGSPCVRLYASRNGDAENSLVILFAMIESKRNERIDRIGTGYTGDAIARASDETTERHASRAII